MAIKDWPADERPREKLLSQGADKLTDAELLAIFLRTGVKGISAVELAQQLLAHFGNLRHLLDADKSHFCQQHGLGEAKFVLLQACLEMSRRHLATTLSYGNAFTDTATTQHYIRQQMRPLQREVFSCLWLDTKHRMITFEPLFHGTIDRAQVYPREVVKKGLAHNAAAVIFAHNHPSGDPTASHADIRLTQQLKTALDLVDIRVLDHIIVGDAQCYSLAQTGEL